MKYALCITSPDIDKPFVFSMMGGPFEKKLSDMAAFGYSGIELLCGWPKLCDCKAVLETCKKNGLEISDVSSGAVFSTTGLTLLSGDRQKRAECAQLFSDMVELAARLGTHIVTIGAFRGWARDIGTREDGENEIARILLALEPRLRENGVSVALEPVNRGQTDIFNTCSETLSFLQRLSMPNVGVLYDTFNADAAEDSPLGALEEVLKAKKLLHFHIADTDRLVPGDGKIDFAAHLKLLKDHGYGGYLSGELKSGDDPTETGRRIIDNMKGFERCI